MSAYSSDIAPLDFYHSTSLFENLLEISISYNEANLRNRIDDFINFKPSRFFKSYNFYKFEYNEVLYLNICNQSLKMYEV